MLRNPDEITQGQTVYLFPHTKTASWNVRQQLAVKVMHAKETILKHWPLVVVEWKEGGQHCWERVHRDDIKLRAASMGTTKVDRAEGDGAQGSGMGRWATRVPVMPGKIKPIDLPDGQEQGALF